MIEAASVGFFTAFSLILAIGAQNAFVLRQGILRQHVFPVCLFCAVSDTILIAAGVAGFGALVAAFPNLPTIMSLGGAAFLIWYGSTRVLSAWRGGEALALGEENPPLLRALATIAAFTWLNPHVYLDTLALIGAVSTNYPDPSEKLIFGVFAALSSFVFFFGLGYGARLLAPVMQSARSWRVLDTIIGVVMFAIAAKLLLDVVS